jgi:hypothetical protein
MRRSTAERGIIDFMAGRTGNRRWRRLALAGTLIYAVVLTMAPAEHHDLACHLKNPQHCTSCSLSPIGADSQRQPTPGACCLADAGRALTFYSHSHDTLLDVRTTGRSPPVFA